MKKISLLLLGVLLSFGMANAQSKPISQGTFVLNPQVLNLGFQSFSIEKQKMAQFGFGFRGGIAVMDDLIMNMQLSYQNINIKYSLTGDDSKIKLNLISIGTGFRYYFPGNFFGGVGLMLTHIDSKYIQYGNPDSDFLEIGADIGYAIYLTPDIALEPFYSYSSKIIGKVQDSKDNSYSRMALNLGVSIFF